MKYLPFLTFILILLFSCSKKEHRKGFNEVTDVTLQKNIKKQDTITAKFNWYETKNDLPYSLEFETEKGKIIHFEDVDFDAFDFVEKLNESETSEYNKGWGINYKLQEKWFNITYTQKKQPKTLNDSTHLFVIKKIVLDTKIRKVEDELTDEQFTVKAKFKEFWLGDAEHYSFEKESGEVISFGGSEIDNFEFAVELKDSEANSENQGWGSNKKLQGKWFKISYLEREKPLYTDGPLENVKIITKAVFDKK